MYTQVGNEFKLLGIVANGNYLEVIKALYHFPTRGNRWHAHLSHALRGTSFKPTHFEPNIFVKKLVFCPQSL